MSLPCRPCWLRAAQVLRDVKDPPPSLAVTALGVYGYTLYKLGGNLSEDLEREAGRRRCSPLSVGGCAHLCCSPLLQASKQLREKERQQRRLDSSLRPKGEEAARK